eukprot:5238161-Lingulodinium_polyedra.AAC.1
MREALANSTEAQRDRAPRRTGASGSRAPGEPVNTVRGVQPKSTRRLQTADLGRLALIGIL